MPDPLASTFLFEDLLELSDGLVSALVGSLLESALFTHSAPSREEDGDVS
jgi:hypothetical protein